MRGCPFCGEGKFRLAMRRLACRVVGHNWSQAAWRSQLPLYWALGPKIVSLPGVQDGVFIDECNRCFLIQAESVDPEDRAMLAVLRGEAA